MEKVKEADGHQNSQSGANGVLLQWLFEVVPILLL